MRLMIGRRQALEKLQALFSTPSQMNAGIPSSQNSFSHGGQCETPSHFLETQPTGDACRRINPFQPRLFIKGCEFLEGFPLAVFDRPRREQIDVMGRAIGYTFLVA